MPQKVKKLITGYALLSFNALCTNFYKKLLVLKPLQALLLAAGGFIIYSLVRKGQALGNLFFYPKSLKGIKFEGATPVMTLGLAVQNTSNQSFTVNSMAGELYANNTFIGNVAVFSPVVINANSEQVIDIRVRLSLLGIVNDIIQGIKNRTISQALELDSIANIDNLQVPINIVYKFGK